MKKLLFLMSVVICCLGLNAQTTRVITGAVIDKNGNPLPNALVEATGGAESVTTDADGSYRIEVPIWLKSITAKYAGLPDKKKKLDGRDQVLFEMKPKAGYWFLNLAGSASFGDIAYGKLGLMGGYLGNWGGYVRALVPVTNFDDYAPSITAGVIKHIFKPFHVYLGVGYTPVYYEDEYSNYYSSWIQGYEAGTLVDIGTIFKFNKINFGVGYSIGIAPDYLNHSLDLSIGYCF